MPVAQARQGADDRRLAREAAAAQAWLSPLLPRARLARRGPPLRLAMRPLPGQTSPEAYTLVVDARQGVTLASQA